MLKEVGTQEEYDTKHLKICFDIISIYRNGGMDLHYGQAQKWVNMFMKYQCILGDNTAQRMIPFLHIPIDNVILKVAKTKFGIIPKAKTCWSKFDKETYVDLQLQLRDSLNGETPIIWEFKAWSNQDSKEA